MKALQIGFDAADRPLYVAQSQRRYHHHIIGSSGGGKSKFLELLMRNDSLAGQGFCLIDPHGTLYADVLKFCAYRTLRRDIILLNLSEPDYIVGFNFFTKEETGKTNVQVDNLIEATLHAWNAKNADATPTLRRTLKVIYTSMLDADLTLPQVAQMIDFKSAKIIKDDLAARIENDLVRREWLELASLTKLADFRAEILSLKNRLFPFLTSETLMRFIGLKGKKIDLLEAMNRQKIILVNLAASENLSHDEARLFGSLLVNQFFQAALRRKKDALGQDPAPYQLYLDEFQNFVSLDLCNMLDEVRKFGLFLNLSHQRFRQLNEDIEDAILANCRIKTVFGGLRSEDAERMAKELFIGQLDPKKIKAAIYQTKHWYRYTRDKVYGRSTSYGEGEGESSGSGSSKASGEQNSTSYGAGSSAGSSYEMQGDGGGGGQMVAAAAATPPPTADGVFTGAMWLSDGASSSQVQSSGFSSSEGTSEFASQSSSSFWSESESVSDVPVFTPVPFQELSSVQYYTPEEQLLELTQALKLQQQRHCFIQLPNQETQPLLVPLVEDYYISKANFDWYVRKLADQAGAITPEEADRIISQAGADLLLLRSEGDDISTDRPPPQQQQQTGRAGDSYSPPPPPPKKSSRTTAVAQDKKKPTIFDRLKQDNPDLNLDSADD
jgi:hypothetical protein